MRDQAPPLYAGIRAKALAGTASPRQAIKAMCLECVGYIRADVASCQITDCPLHKYRPYAAERPAEAEDLAESGA